MLPASRLSNYVPKFLRSYSLISYVLVARGSIYLGWHGFSLGLVEFVFPVTLSVFSLKTFLRYWEIEVLMNMAWLSWERRTFGCVMTPLLSFYLLQGAVSTGVFGLK